MPPPSYKESRAEWAGADGSLRVNIKLQKSIFVSTLHTITAREPCSLLAETLRQRLNGASAPSALTHVELEFDRSSGLFLPILNYLRTGLVTAPQMDERQTKAMLAEAKHYRLYGMVTQIERLLTLRQGSIDRRTLKARTYSSTTPPKRSHTQRREKLARLAPSKICTEQSVGAQSDLFFDMAL